jgi:hypothetical protein
VGYDVAVTISVKGTIFRTVASCRLINVYQHFGRMHRSHHQGRKVRQGSRKLGLFYPETADSAFLRKYMNYQTAFFAHQEVMKSDL